MEQFYSKSGYLNSDFKMFHLKDPISTSIDYHYHDFNKILIFISGDVTYNIEGRNYSLQPFDIVLVKAGEVHRPILHGTGTYERMIIYISQEFLATYKTEEYDLSRCFLTAAEEKTNVLRIPCLENSQLYQCASDLESSYKNNDYASELNHQILFLRFLIQLNRAVIHHKIDYIQNTSSNNSIIKVIEYINTHLTEDLSPDLLSSKCFLNRYYLMHLFKAETGYTLGNYINLKRLLYARDLISQGSSVTNACFLCGFKNYSTFSRAYKKEFNCCAHKIR